MGGVGASPEQADKGSSGPILRGDHPQASGHIDLEETRKKEERKIKKRFLFFDKEAVVVVVVVVVVVRGKRHQWQSFLRGKLMPYFLIPYSLFLIPTEYVS